MAGPGVHIVTADLQAELLQQYIAIDPTSRAGATIGDVYNSMFGIPAVTSFLAGGAYMTLATLLATYPAGVAYADRYANVSNLYNGTSTSAVGGVREVVRCRQDVANGVYNWVPQREGYNVTVAQTSGAFTAIPLVTPPTVRFSATLLGNLSMSASATNAYVGQKQKFLMPGSLGIFLAQVTGLIGSNLTLLGGGAQEIEYTASGWAKATD